MVDWTTPTLRQRREQVRDDINAHLPGADSRVPNSVLRITGDAIASQVSDLDAHLAYIARMMMPDTAEGDYADRWANIWLPNGRKSASFSAGQVTVTGDIGAAIPTGSTLSASFVDSDGNPITLVLAVTEGVTLAATSQDVKVESLVAGAFGNLDAGTGLTFDDGLAGIDAAALVASGGLVGGADIEPDAELVPRYIDVVQQPPHGGRANDYVQWAKEVAGVTRAWGAQEMGVGTYTVRFMLDTVRADADGIPTAGDITLVADYLAKVRPTTVAELFVEAPTAQPLNITVTGLSPDTPEVREAIDTELAAMLLARSAPGQTIYGSWISEAISLATGEDHHSGGFSDVTATTAGHIVTPGTVTYA